MASYLSYVHAVTDAELEALEKQIEQLESEEKKAEAEAKRKAKAEAKRKAEVEAKKQAEEKRNQEAEEKRLVEEEMKRQEEVVKKRAEEEKKEKYNLLIAEAEQAVKENQKEIATNKYKKALDLYPNDQIALNGLKVAEHLIDKRCLDAVVGVWKPKWLFGTTVFRPDGTANLWSGAYSDVVTKWECVDPTIPLIRTEDEYAIQEYIPLSNGCLQEKSDYNKDGVWGTPYKCLLKRGEYSEQE